MMMLVSPLSSPKTKRPKVGFEKNQKLESVLIVKAIPLFDFALDGRGTCDLAPYHFEILLVEFADNDGRAVLDNRA